MNLSETYIRRPIATSLMMLAIAFFGMVAYRSLPVSDLPNVDLPTLLVTASLPGANPDTMASAVATPLENNFSMIAGLSSMTSINSLGNTQITLEFDLSRNLDGAAVDVQAAITQSSRLLPQGMPTPPTFTKVNPADQPILYLALTCSTLPLYTLDEYAETRIAQRISMVSGVAQVQVLGAQRYAVHIQADPRALAARQVGINEVENALRGWNVNLPIGSIVGPQRAFTLQASGQLMNAAQYEPVIVAYRNGSPIRLSELATVVDGIEDDKSASWFYHEGGEERAIVLAIQRQPGTNTMSVTEGVKKLLPVFQNELPPSVKLNILYDRSETIRESYDDVKFTMVLTLGLVIMVIFLFLRNFSATIIPSLALPFSIIGTFAVMYLLDYSLDNLSMMALILSVGFVVDDAIVMLENIVRHIEMGKKPMEAALEGSREIGFTIVSMTFSLAAVFIPVLFMGGVLGRLFREFAVTICAAILISGIVSVTLTPMLCSRFLQAMHGPKKHNWLYRTTEAFFDGMLHLYDSSLQWVLRFRAVTVLGFLVLLVATGWMFTVIPKGFIPDQDTDQIIGFTEANEGTSYTQMTHYQKAIAQMIAANPNVEAMVSSLGGTTSSTLGGPNFGQLIIHLKPRKQRTQGVEEIISELRPHLSEFPGLRVYLQNPPTVQIGGQITKSPYQFSLQSPDRDELFEIAEKFTKELADAPELRDVTSNLQVRAPQVHVKIDRDKAAALQVNVEQIENALYDAFGPRWVSTIYGSANEYKVLLELLPEDQKDPKALSLLYFKGTGNRLIPLDSVAKITEDTGPQTINHFGQLPAVTVSFNLQPGVPLGNAVQRVTDMAKTIPSSVSSQFQGEVQAFGSSQTNLTVLLGVAIMVVYIVLGVLYESYIHPLTILSGLPSAAFGALLTLMIFNRDLNIYGFVGLIMLIGIVEKNAIMQIDFALDAERTQGLSPVVAIHQGCLIRFRPIMMTTMAALLGAVPIALGFGAGGESRQSLGLVVCGGLIFSQMVTLYLTPVVYTYMAAIQDRVRGKKSASTRIPVPVAGD